MKQAIFLALAAIAVSPADAQQVPRAGMQNPGESLSISSFAPVLRVVQIEKELEFYTKVLGMKVAASRDMGGTRKEYMLEFAGNAPSGLTLVHDSAVPATQILNEGNGFSHFVLRVSDLDIFIRRLDAAHIAHGPVRDVSQRARLLIIQDPEGYRFEVVQPVTQK